MGSLVYTIFHCLTIKKYFNHTLKSLSRGGANQIQGGEGVNAPPPPPPERNPAIHNPVCNYMTFLVCLCRKTI